MPPANRAATARRANSLVIEPPRGTQRASPGGGPRHGGQRPGAGGTCVGAVEVRHGVAKSGAHCGGRRRATLHTLGGSPERMGLGAVAVSVQSWRSTAYGLASGAPSANSRKLPARREDARRAWWWAGWSGKIVMGRNQPGLWVPPSPGSPQASCFCPQQKTRKVRNLNSSLWKGRFKCSWLGPL